MERLQKVIAQAGVCSRRKAEELIVEKKVRVNGHIVSELGFKVSDEDKIEVNGTRIKREKKEYYLLYKPRSIISSTNDEHDRKTVIDLIPEARTRLFPIGRLDYDTTGLILLTNDGDFANLMMHPSSEVKKTYVAYVDGIIDATQIKQLERGVEIDGYMTKNAKARILEKDFKHSTSKIRLTISEGKNHQVKKMFEALGLPVRKLHREKYGEFTLDGLKPGQYFKLKSTEIEEIINVLNSQKRVKR